MIKPTLCEGYYTRGAPLDRNDFHDHTEFIVRSQLDYEEALNRAWSRTGKSLIILATSGMSVSMPSISGKTRAEEIVIHGGAGQQTESLHGDKWRVLTLQGSNNFGFSNLHMDGQEGFSQKGLVMGASWGEDSNASPANDIWLDHVEISGVQQQLIKWSDSSQHLSLKDVDLHSNGFGGQKYAEGFYGGEGSGSGTHKNPRYLTAIGLYVGNIRGSEAIDLKVNVTDVNIQWFELEDIAARYSGALTLFVNNSDGHHGRDNNWNIGYGHIHNVRSMEHSFSGVQLGSGGHLHNLHIEDIPDGHAIQALDQSAGPNSHLVLNRIAGNDFDGELVKMGGSIGEVPPKNPMTVTSKDVFEVTDSHPVDLDWLYGGAGPVDPPPIDPPPIDPPVDPPVDPELEARVAALEVRANNQAATIMEMAALQARLAGLIAANAEDIDELNAILAAVRIALG